MNLSLSFPAPTTQKYYRHHYTYVLNLLRPFVCSVNLVEDTCEYVNAFYFRLGKTRFLVDYSDAGNLKVDDLSLPMLKFHYDDRHVGLKNVYPFPPQSFHNWDTFENISSSLKYKPTKDKQVFYRQLAYGGALTRRTKLAEILATNDQVLIGSTLPKTDFWKTLDRYRGGVFVGGQHENMLDRAILQCMGFGIGCFSTIIPEFIRPNVKLIPGTHYIPFANDYSNVNNVIKETDPNDLLEVGQNAKEFFGEYCTPSAVFDYVKSI
jgi:hypothetical protein